MEPFVDEMFKLPMIALRGLCVFPNTSLRFDIGRKKSMNAVHEAMQDGKEVFLVAQKNMQEEM